MKDTSASQGDGSDGVNIDEFVSGCYRLSGEATTLHTQASSSGRHASTSSSASKLIQADTPCASSGHADGRQSYHEQDAVGLAMEPHAICMFGFLRLTSGRMFWKFWKRCAPEGEAVAVGHLSGTACQQLST